LGSFYCIISSFQSLILNYNGIRFKNSSWSNSGQRTNYKDHINLVNPANKRNIDIIVVGTGLAGSSAATLAELGYNVKSFCFQDSPRRAHSIAAQGESMLQNYQGDGDSTFRLFYDTVKGRLPLKRS
jgi:succinate dehydrogenase / fumarate reductase flavoprotein subunit